MLDGRVIDAHADERGSQHLRRQLQPREGELRVEILARAVVAFERLHVEPTYDGSPFEQVVKCEKPGAVAGFVVTADEWERQLAGSGKPASAGSLMQ
ncbi:MAG: hypothetical protein ACM3X2_00500 [Pseudomonadota bacterium]